ncbi:sensor domain-containing diguanylate cyclase [Phosphitispora fastidiosa]|uniref:sensor domain-containing diguanylate cyclase n=1 Tax=Phosphitispora fastidiosa TaxID=2837202 RepID=UPI001E601AE7|nr:diguanylate cyclase [Phosphitispora fastidiosa]MBU7008757.1 diguanylate cyclase (GGDEF)-like protein/PAS domain S-box-containing protein [Phosphitispora fastidiosa]
MNRFFDVDVLLSLFESMHIGIIFVDPDGIIRYCNVSAGIMKNIPREALVGRKLEDCHPKETYVKIEEMIRNACGKKFAEWKRIDVHSEPDLEKLVSPVFTPEGEFIGLVLVSLDITGKRELTDRIRKSEKELSALFKVSHTINSSLNLNDVLFKILLLAVEVINFTSGTIYLLDEAREKLVPMATTDCLLGETPVETIDFASPDSIIAFAVRSGEMVSLERGRPGFDKIVKRPETSAVFVLPLKDQDKCLGALVVESEERDVFGLEEQELLHTFANHAAAAIKNAQLFAKTQKMAFVDGLTGLYNRQYFDQVLDQAVAQLKRKDLYLTIIMVDVNDLKFINDFFGHIMGDQIIQAAAHVLQYSVRDSDTVCRYGGDELVMLLPNTTREEALIVHKRILENVAKWNEEQNNNQDISLALSIGTATAFGREGLSDILTRADQSMYEDKRRYKLGIHDETPIERAKKQYYSSS